MHVKAWLNLETLLRKHIVADTNVSQFSRAGNICCGNKFCCSETRKCFCFKVHITYFFQLFPVNLQIARRRSAQKFFDLLETRFFGNFLKLYQTLYFCGPPSPLIKKAGMRQAHNVTSCDVV